MKPTRSISRRSLLGRVGRASLLVLGGCTGVGAPIEERPPGSPRVPRREPLGGSAGRGCTDGDSGRHVDPPGHGRGCRTSTEERRRRRSNQ
jgi:hypothetical protein